MGWNLMREVMISRCTVGEIDNAKRTGSTRSKRKRRDGTGPGTGVRKGMAVLELDQGRYSEKSCGVIRTIGTKKNRERLQLRGGQQGENKPENTKLPDER